MYQILLYSSISGLATAIGGLFAIYLCKPECKTISVLLGFAAGVMLGVTFFDLLPGSIEYSSWSLAVLGFALGVLLMYGLERLVPHLHKRQIIAGSNPYIKMGIFVALGIALHNLPEGLAIGAGYEAAPELGGMIAIAIALHNIPEGLGLSIPLKAGKMEPLKIIGICLLAGIFTPIGTLLGTLFMGLSQSFVGMSLAFAAGAMLYIAFDELVPESYRQAGYVGNFGLAAGVLLTVIIH